MRAVGRAPDRERLLAYRLLSGALTPEDTSSRNAEVDWVAAADIDARIARLGHRAERLGTRYSLPDWLAEELLRDHGDEADALAASLNERAPMTIRANTLKISREKLATRLAASGLETDACAFASHGLIVRTRTNLFGTAEFKEGLFEAQDEGSQLLAELVAPPPRSLAVDFCAGAGGKTLALAAALENRGRLLACDIDARKLAELKRRARRAGVDNVETAVLGAEKGAAFPAALDRSIRQSKRVLTDVPCTGLGALRRNPEARWRLRPADLARLPELQLGIARRALELVAPGGRLIYATCSVLAAENQGVVAALLAGEGDLEVVALGDVLGAERAEALTAPSGDFLQTLPHRHGCDGFFAAVIRRRRS